MYINMYMYIFN